VRRSLTLERTAKYRYRVGEEEPYTTLEINFDQCLAYLGAFRVQSGKLWSIAVGGRFATSAHRIRAVASLEFVT
jgi:hypothetical protein